jgi:sugar phosphate isomerase/epimerase
MKHHELKERLAVCSWSLQPTDLKDLAAKLQATGISRVQLALDPLRKAPEKWNNVLQHFTEHDIQLVSGMFGCVGEDYSTLESIRLTGGLAPDATWEENRKNIQATAALAQSLGLKLVTFHAGFLPHDESDRNFIKMLKRLDEVADVFARVNIVVGLETGQETASLLARLMEKVNRANLSVNFDPANMILYGKGDPIEALQLLGGWIRQVHVKDAKHSKTPGVWGEEVPAGHGEVDWKTFFSTLRQQNFSGPIVIEREAGTQRVEDIRAARKVAESAFA